MVENFFGQVLQKFLVTFLFICCVVTNAKVVKVVDLSYDVNDEMIYWPNGTPFQLFIKHRGLLNSTIQESDDNFWYEINDFKMAEHSGTHLDAPVHFARHKWSVDQIPPDRFVGAVSLIDLRETVKDNADYEISKEDLLEWESKNKRQLDSLVILWTGWSSNWPHKKKYLGTDTDDISLLRFPGLHPTAAKWLVDNRQIHGIGIDTASIDFGQSKSFLTHRTLAKENIFFMENINTKLLNLDDLPNPILVVNPLKITSGSGSPVRPILIFGTPVTFNAHMARADEKTDL